MKRVRSAAAVILDDEGRVLLMQRGSKAKHSFGKWEKVGGKLDAGEDARAGIIREVHEELGVELMVTKELFTYDHHVAADDTVYEAVVYEGRVAGVPQNMEPDKCSAIGWFSREQIKDLDLADYARDDFVRLGWL